MIHATMHAMIRGRIAMLLAGLVMLLPSIAAAAPDTERRIALVIGIGAYQNAPHLNNPVNDARAIGDSLR
ncbi:MAG TPA: caspase family protein, partial [Rhodopila sp.]|nr:caspase family protein [Rhodopila sp.]